MTISQLILCIFGVYMLAGIVIILFLDWLFKGAVFRTLAEIAEKREFTDIQKLVLFLASLIFWAAVLHFWRKEL